MMADEGNNFSLDVSAESSALGASLQSEDMSSDNNVVFLPTPDLPESSPSEFLNTPELPDSTPFEFTEQTYEKPNVESAQILGQDYSILKDGEIESSLDDVSAKVDDMFDEFGSIKNGVSNGLDMMRKYVDRSSAKDNFEERVTILPTNLIYDNRLQRMMEPPSWK